MISFRIVVCVILIIVCVVFVAKQSILSPGGFFIAIAAIFVTGATVGMIWPFSHEKENQDEEDG